MSHAALLACYANPLLIVDAADFDVTNDYMTRGAGLTGAADSKSGILSVWVRIDGGDGGSRQIITGDVGGSKRFEVSLNSSNQFHLIALDSADGDVISIRSASAYSSGATWRHLLLSWDQATTTSHLYVADVEDRDTPLADVDATIDYTLSDWSVGATVAGATKFNGPIAELYFAPGQYLDFSNVYNRRKFISAGGKPVYLGATGAVPTGTAPIAYFHLDDAEAVANFATNRGTGGNFTITGTLETASTSPSD